MNTEFLKIEVSVQDKTCMKVLLLDEITVDMDVVGRLDLLKFFVEECETRGATIIYATHIFDGLEKWITHIAYLMDGHLRIGELLSIDLLKPT